MMLQKIEGVSVWTIIIKSSLSSEVKATVTLEIEELAMALEATFDARRLPRAAEVPRPVFEFLTAFSSLNAHEQQTIRNQVSELEFPLSGGTYVLDVNSNQKGEAGSGQSRVASHRHTIHEAAGVDFGRHTIKLRCYNSAADKAFHWLLAEYNLTRADNHRFQFGLNVEGVLHSSENFSIYLLNAHESRRSKGKMDKPAQNGQSSESLIVAKIAHNTVGLDLLKVEARAMQNLQHTGRVAELWDPDNTDHRLDQGALLTVYYPVPLESNFEMWMSKWDIQLLASELLAAVNTLHENGWIWNGLKTGHYLYNLIRRYDRDMPAPLRAIGLEKALFVGKNAPEAIQGEHNLFSLKGDEYSLGLLLRKLCCRCPRLISASSSDGLDNQERDAIVSAHNRHVYDPSKLLRNDDWLLDLTDRLLKKDPSQRLSAEGALRYVRAHFRTRTEEEDLVLGQVSKMFIPGFLDPSTTRFVWPMTLHATVVHDIFAPGDSCSPRLTKEMTLKASLKMKAKAVAAKYGGRPTHRRAIRWLQLLGLHTHSISDGKDGAMDGRREANGIFDLPFYEQTKQVR
jgi:hypothetical protein